MMSVGPVVAGLGLGWMKWASVSTPNAISAETTARM